MDMYRILIIMLSYARAVNNTGKKYWQYQYLLIKVLAIPIPILFLKSIAIPIPILYQYFSISKFVFNPIKCMLTMSSSRLIQFMQHRSTCSLMGPTLYINAHTTNDYFSTCKKSSFKNAGLITEENTLPPKEKFFQQVNYTVRNIERAKYSAVEISDAYCTKLFLSGL